MAWISVHEQIEGLKLRELSKAIGCSPKEALGILVSLWLWGINNADCEGILKSADKTDIKDALSTGLSNGLSPEKVVECLIDKKWIDEKSGVFILHDWDVWQEQWYKALNRRTYDASRKREERKKQNVKCPVDSLPENPVQPSPSPSPSPKDIDTDKERKDKLTFSGNVFLSPDEYSRICLKFNAKNATFQTNHFIILLSQKKSNGYKPEDDFKEIINLIDNDNNLQKAANVE